MNKLKLSIACDMYDHIQPLIDGSVSPKDIDLNIVTVVGGDRHDKMIKGEFDLAEFSLGSYLVAVGKGKPLSAIPVFPRRMFGHRYAYINTNSGIASPQDLRGKKVSIIRYGNSLALWFRGLLQHFYGVSPNEIHWILGRTEVVEGSWPSNIRVTPLQKGSDISKMLAKGELDAVIYPESPELEISKVWKSNSPHIKRLFPDVRSAERQYFGATGDFPIMHLIVGRKDQLEAEPWIAQSLYEAFEQSKLTWFRKMESPTFVSLAWGTIELEEEKRIIGEARWPYGVEPNRKSLEQMVQYATEQGLIRAPIPLERLFCFHE